MSTAQDSATTTNAPTASSPQSNPAEKMSQCEKVDVIDSPTSSLAPVAQSASQSASQSQSAVSAQSGSAAPSSSAAAAAAASLARSPSHDGSQLVDVLPPSKKPSTHFGSIPKPPSAPQSPGRSAVTKSKGPSSRPKRHRCRSCRGAANPMMGTCPDCELVFCNSHRMPEDHNCLQAESRRVALKNEHRETMMRNATRPNKIIQF